MMMGLAKDYKLVLLGDQRVGKSSIVNRLKYGKFNDNYEATIGVDFMTKRERYDDWNFRLLMWDISGQERFQYMVLNFIKISPVALIVYDVSDKQTFLNTSKLFAQVRAERRSDVLIVLVGNKTDLVDKRQVTTEEGDNKASEFGALFMETSAKDGFNIQALFSKIGSALRRNDRNDRNEVISLMKKSDLLRKIISGRASTREINKILRQIVAK